MFAELQRLRCSAVAANIYTLLIQSIPWQPGQRPSPTIGQWLAPMEPEGDITQVFLLKQTNPVTATRYIKTSSEQLQLAEDNQPLLVECGEVRIVRNGGPRNATIDFNPHDPLKDEQAVWLWGNKPIENLEWDPKDWTWRRIGILPETNILNYSTKRGYRVALRQDNNQMHVDAELEAAGYNSKARAKFFNKVWHPYLPCKVSAMQWLILTEGLPVGVWREKIGLPSDCQLARLAREKSCSMLFRTALKSSRLGFYSTTPALQQGSDLHTFPSSTQVAGLCRNRTAQVWTTNFGGIRLLPSLSTQIHLGIYCAPNSCGPFGAREWHTRSAMKCFILEWLSEMRGETPFTAPSKHTKNYSAINATKKKGRNLSPAFNKSGPPQASLAAYGVRTLNGISHRMKLFCHRNLVPGWCHPFVFTGFPLPPTRRRHSPLEPISPTLSTTL